jgi:hypothetical protein
MLSWSTFIEKGEQRVQRVYKSQAGFWCALFLYLSGGDFGYGCNQLVEPFSFIPAEIRFDYRGLFHEERLFEVPQFSESVDVIKRGFRFKYQFFNERPKDSFSIVSRVFQSVFTGNSNAVRGNLKIDKPSSETTKRAPDRAIEGKFGRIELNYGHVVLWALATGVISFLAGWGARNILTGDPPTLEKPYRIGGNTTPFHMTYIV